MTSIKYCIYYCYCLWYLPILNSKIYILLYLKKHIIKLRWYSTRYSITLIHLDNNNQNILIISSHICSTSNIAKGSGGIRQDALLAQYLQIK